MIFNIQGNMYYNRLVEEKIEELSQHFSVIGIIGPRQVGKTTLVKHISSNILKEVMYFDLELSTDIDILENPEFIFQQYEDKCVIIDEVQRMPELFPLIRALVDQNPVASRFILLGSAAPSLIRKSSESLAGRISYIELHPFNQMELPENITFEKHWYKGGYPKSLFQNNDKVSYEWLRAFIRTYIETDLPQLGLNVSSVSIRRFWTMLAHHHGGLWNASDFGRSLGLTHPTVNKYLDYLEGAFLVRRLHPFYSNIGKRLVKSPKIYIRDSGILHQLINIESFDNLALNIKVGASFEGYVVEQIDILKPDSHDLFFYRTQAGSECDLVITKGQIPVACCEIKFSNSPSTSKGFRISIQDLNTNLNFVITPSSEDYLIDKNIRVCSLNTFLTKYLAVI